MARIGEFVHEWEITPLHEPLGVPEPELAPEQPLHQEEYEPARRDDE